MAGFMFSFSRCICLVFFGGGGYQEGSAVGSSLSWGGVLSLMAGVSPEAHPLGPVLVALWSPRSTSCQSTAGCWVQLSASGTCCTGLVHSRGILVYILPHFLLYFLSVFYYKSGPSREYQGDLDDCNCCMPVKADTLRILQSPFP